MIKFTMKSNTLLSNLNKVQDNFKMIPDTSIFIQEAISEQVQESNQIPYWSGRLAASLTDDVHSGWFGNFQDKVDERPESFPIKMSTHKEAQRVYSVRDTKYTNGTLESVFGTAADYVPEEKFDQRDMDSIVHRAKSKVVKAIQYAFKVILNP